MTELALPQISTTVRARRSVTARLMFWAAQRVGTPVAAALLERFFLTPRRAELTREEAAFLAGGMSEQLETETGHIATWTWGEGRTVLLVHGWGSRAGRYRTVAPALVDAGYRVVAIDAPGHGASSGRRSSLPETARAIRAVAGREAERRGAWPFALVAHSFGASAAILAQRDGGRFKRNVFLAPATDFNGYLDRVADALGISATVVEAMIARVERRLRFCWDEVAMDRMASGTSAPALIFHDPADAEVPFSDAQLLHRCWVGSQLVRTPALGHRRLLHDPAVVERIISFVREGGTAGLSTL
jgi:pimeloyl-ACP methyl ester carboxylesterase